MQKEKEANASAVLLRQWLRLVKSCEKDAANELFKIYTWLMWEKGDVEPIRKLKRGKVDYELGNLVNTILICPVQCYNVDDDEVNGDTLLIYILNGALCYGPASEKWPLRDKSNWPWTLANKKVPPLCRDIYQCIMKHMDPRSVLRLSVTCKAALAAGHGDWYWDKYRKWLRERVALAGPLLDRMPAWQLYSKMLYCHQRSDNRIIQLQGISFVNFALNLFYPIGSSNVTTAPIPAYGDSRCGMRDDEVAESHFILINGRHRFGFIRKHRSQKVTVALGISYTGKTVFLAQAVSKLFGSMLRGKLYPEKHSAFRSWELSKQILLDASHAPAL